MSRARNRIRTRTLAVVVMLLSAAACSDDPASPPGPPEGTLEVVVSGLILPVHLAAPEGDDRLFVIERRGTIVIVEADTVHATPFLDISSLTASGGERGLLGLAFHPAYASNGNFYVNYTDASGNTRIVRYTVSGDPNVADPASAQTVLGVDQPYANHNGGQVAFGPDGMLYVGMGDGGSAGDPLEHGQNRATLLGAMLRLDVDAGSPYSIPADNPFVGVPGTAPEIWAFGLRNPWRFSFDRARGDLYIADVGQNAIEEISFQPAASTGGENYGWRVMEGSSCYSPSTGCDQTGLDLPVYEYDHDEGCSVTGGFVYRGAANPTLSGRYFFADFCDGWIRSFRMDGGRAVDVVDHTEAFGQVPSVTSFGEDGHGELYVLSGTGIVYRVVEPS